VLIVIDLSEERAFLADPDDFGRFSVALEGRGGQAGVVHRAGLGRLEDEGLSGMCAYAAGRGWVEADGGVLAHVERRDESG
jgi:hypothetical protein